MAMPPLPPAALAEIERHRRWVAVPRLHGLHWSQEAGAVGALVDRVLALGVQRPHMAFWFITLGLWKETHLGPRHGPIEEKPDPLAASSLRDRLAAAQAIRRRERTRISDPS